MILGEGAITEDNFDLVLSYCQHRADEDNLQQFVDKTRNAFGTSAYLAEAMIVQARFLGQDEFAVCRQAWDDGVANGPVAALYIQGLLDRDEVSNAISVGQRYLARRDSVPVRAELAQSYVVAGSKDDAKATIEAMVHVPKTETVIKRFSQVLATVNDPDFALAKSYAWLQAESSNKYLAANVLFAAGNSKKKRFADAIYNLYQDEFGEFLLPTYCRALVETGCNLEALMVAESVLEEKPTSAGAMHALLELYGTIHVDAAFSLSTSLVEELQDPCSIMHLHGYFASQSSLRIPQGLNAQKINDFSLSNLDHKAALMDFILVDEKLFDLLNNVDTSVKPLPLIISMQHGFATKLGPLYGKTPKDYLQDYIACFPAIFNDNKHMLASAQTAAHTTGVFRYARFTEFDLFFKIGTESFEQEAAILRQIENIPDRNFSVTQSLKTFAHQDVFYHLMQREHGRSISDLVYGELDYKTIQEAVLEEESNLFEQLVYGVADVHSASLENVGGRYPLKEKLEERLEGCAVSDAVVDYLCPQLLASANWCYNNDSTLDNWLVAIREEEAKLVLIDTEPKGIVPNTVDLAHMMVFYGAYGQEHFMPTDAVDQYVAHFNLRSDKKITNKKAFKRELQDALLYRSITALGYLSQRDRPVQTSEIAKLGIKYTKQHAQRKDFPDIKDDLIDYFSSFVIA